MGWRDELNGVDWPSLQHAYGTAADVPSLLEALTGPEHAEATSDLWAAVLHQGSIYDSTPPTMIAIAAIIADGAAAEPDFAGWLLQVFGRAVTAMAEDPNDSDDDGLLAACGGAQRRIAELLLPLLNGSGPLVAALSQQVLTPPSPEVLKALATRASQTPPDELAWACMATLAYLRVDDPPVDKAPGQASASADLGLGIAAAVARIDQGRATASDVALICDQWSLAVEVGTTITMSAEPFIEWLEDVNPGFAAQVLAALPTLDDSAVELLVAQALRNPATASPASAQLVRAAVAVPSDPTVFIEALRQLPPGPAVIDALVTTAQRITDSRPHLMRHSRETDPRADAAWVLYREDDPRWSALLRTVLLTNPAVCELWVATAPTEWELLGAAFGNAPVPPGAQSGATERLHHTPNECPGAAALMTWLT